MLQMLLNDRGQHNRCFQVKVITIKPIYIGHIEQDYEHISSIPIGPQNTTCKIRVKPISNQRPNVIAFILIRFHIININIWTCL